MLHEVIETLQHEFGILIVRIEAQGYTFRGWKLAPPEPRNRE
jgi:hypothetical protein